MIEMIDLVTQPPQTENDVVVVLSRPAGPDQRAFTLEAAGLGAPELPDDLGHETDLIKLMKKHGFRLTMVGGGSRIDELRRFYFRPDAC